MGQSECTVAGTHGICGFRKTRQITSGNHVVICSCPSLSDHRTPRTILILAGLLGAESTSRGDTNISEQWEVGGDGAFVALPAYYSMSWWVVCLRLCKTQRSNLSEPLRHVPPPFLSPFQVKTDICRRYDIDLLGRYESILHVQR